MLNNRKIRQVNLTNGLVWIEIPEASLYLLCGCPADSIKHMIKRGLIQDILSREGIKYESGPNAILLSDIMLQNGLFSNMGEFPIMQMLYKQGMILPNHPGNTGRKPLLIGSREQVNNQMQYIYRGNYGLISKEEIMSAGISKKEAEEMLRLKLKFAFGNINHPGKLLDSCIVEDKKKEITKGVSIERLQPNVFNLKYKKEEVRIDLNLTPSEHYGRPYELNFHNTKREYFTIVHSGEGDGWDTDRPSMSSIIIYQGKVYLIDAGPNIDYTLNCLGIGVNEVHGIFHTHSHDDHFAGLTILMRTDHRIKYFATPLVRKSVTAKLSALLSLEHEDFDHYFDTVDLDFDEWNDIEGLQVKPIFSPHPVETSIFNFRTRWADGYKTYAHLADIISLDVLKSMIVSDKKQPGISKAMFKKVEENYLCKHDVKKIDIGGGLIHGQATDFKKDESDHIILAHTSEELLSEQKEIGSGSPFGTVSCLVSPSHDYLYDYADEFLTTYYPNVARSAIQSLLNCPIIKFNPESILIKNDEVNKYVYLILTGNVDAFRSDEGIQYCLSAGAILGELSGITGIEVTETYRTTSFVNALKIPSSHYGHFITKNNLYHNLESFEDQREFLRKSWLFGESISNPVLNNIAEKMELISIPSGIVSCEDYTDSILLLESGEINLTSEGVIMHELSSGDFLGEELAIFNFPQCFTGHALTDCKVYKIPASFLNKIPVVRFKLHEIYEMKVSSLLSSKLGNKFFKWIDEYSVNIHEIDQHHRKMFIMCCLSINLITKNEKLLKIYLELLYNYTKKQFSSEESVMKMYQYPNKNEHTLKHKNLLVELKEYLYGGSVWKTRKEGIEFFRSWLVKHNLDTDKEYALFLNSKGVY